jgi:single-strand DNA-binding protein
MNIVILKGNITRDPELKSLPSGTKVTEFSIAINESYKNSAGEKVEKTLFVECQSWGVQGEVISKHLKTGDPILINGKLSIESWEDKETHRKMYKTRVVIEHFEFCGGKRQADYNKSGSEPKVAQPSPTPTSGNEFSVEDDIPF